MSFDWKEYFILGELLSKMEPSTEAAHRSAVSRVYYAAFHCVKDYLEDKGANFARNKNIHQEVIEFINGIDPENEINIRVSDYLRDLRDSRNNVDYDDTLASPVDKLSAKGIITARRIIQNIEKLQENTRS